MGNQNVDYAQVGSTADTGEGGTDAIRPIADGEQGAASVFNRPSENLRTRTEVIRSELEALKYLIDADRSLHIASSNTVWWGGLSAGANQGKFGINGGGSITIRPFLAPLASTQAQATIRAMKFATIAAVSGGVNPPRAYSGANKISVQLTGADGATLSAAVASGASPADDFIITLNTNASTGTTKQQLVDYLTNSADAGAVAFRNAGLVASIASGVGTDIIAPGVTFGATDTQTLSGAADAEEHIITAGGLTTFFGTAGNAMVEGDVLCVWYDSLVASGSFGGRRQSLPDAPENSATVDNNLFLLKNNPERLPYALPVCRVTNGNLVFIDGTAVAPTYNVTLGSAQVDASNVTVSDLAAWADAIPNTALASVWAALNRIVSLLASTVTTGDGDGSAKMGIAAISGTPTAITAGTLRNAISTILTALNAHVNSTTAHAAVDITYAGGGNWADGTTNPAATVEAQLDSIIAVLAAATGAAKVGAAALANWKDGTTNPAGTLQAVVAKIVSDLAATTGAAKVGVTATGGIASTDVQGALAELDSEKGTLAADNIWTGVNTFNGGADETQPAQRTTIAPSARKLLAEWQGPAAEGKIRLYQTSNALSFTINARWNGTQWVADATTRMARMIGIQNSQTQPMFFENKATTTSAWADAGWDSNSGTVSWVTPADITVNAASIQQTVAGIITVALDFTTTGGYSATNTIGSIQGTHFTPIQEIPVAAFSDNTPIMLLINSSTGDIITQNTIAAGARVRVCTSYYGINGTLG